MDQLGQKGTLTNWPSTFKTRQDTLDIDFQNMSGARQRLLCSDGEESESFHQGIILSKSILSTKNVAVIGHFSPKGVKNSVTVFTTLHILRNLHMGPMS